MRKITTILSVSALAFGVAACGETEKTSVPEDTVVEETVVEEVEGAGDAAPDAETMGAMEAEGAAAAGDATDHGVTDHGVTDHGVTDH